MNRIGRYEVTGRLGRGGMSTVYKAKAPVTGRLVAIKILQPRDDIFVELVGEEKLREIFVEEARIMGELSHDHVAKILDCDEHDGQPFIVLEYFAHSIGSFIGESYRVETPSRIISIAKTKIYLLQALRGLERLHFSGIIHRDIKPFNLMLTSDDRIKIIDFGLSRVRGEEKMAIPGMQVGSPYYAAPEQEKDSKKVDGRADLYSLGVLAYRMLTGHLFDYRKQVPSPSTLNGEVGQRWDRFVAKAIARDPTDRFADCQEMRLSLEQLPVRQSYPFVKDDENVVMEDLAEVPVRSESCRIMFKEMRAQLELDELFHPYRYLRSEFEILGPLLVREKNTNLYWQRRGSGFTLNWQQAKDYIDYLNSQNWQSRSTWRLPTVDELRTILSPPVHTAAHSSWPMFDSSIHWLWSADVCTRKQAWMVDVVESFFERLDRDGVASVCAVSNG